MSGSAAKGPSLYRVDTARSGLAAAACVFLALVVTSSILLLLLTGGELGGPVTGPEQVEVGMLSQLGGSLVALGLACAWPMRLTWKGDGAVLSPLVRYALALPIWLAVAVSASMVWASLGWPLADQPHLSYFADAQPGLAWLGVMVSVCVVGPILEEVIFRGFLFDGLAARHGTRVAVVASALLFGLVHIGAGTVLLLPISALGALFAWLRLRHGGLLAPILAHVAHNSLMVTVVSLVPDLLPTPS
jgi:membrane protease YdiL (CAAX protease family)